MADETTPSTDGWDDVPEYSSVRKEEKVKVDGTRYILRDMMGDDLAEWSKFQATRVMAGAKRGRPDPAAVDFRGFNAKLISMCLYHVGPDGKVAGPVAQSVIEKWSAPVLTALFDRCQTMNGLNEEGQEAAKKA